MTIPAQRAKRLVILRYLRDRCFTEDRAYPEKEVNQRLAIFHPDVAALRRYMVDEGLMTRSGGEYRRPGLTGRPTSARSAGRPLGGRSRRRPLTSRDRGRSHRR